VPKKNGEKFNNGVIQTEIADLMKSMVAGSVAAVKQQKESRKKLWGTTQLVGKGITHGGSRYVGVQRQQKEPYVFQKERKHKTREGGNNSLLGWGPSGRWANHAQRKPDAKTKNFNIDWEKVN